MGRFQSLWYRIEQRGREIDRDKRQRREALHGKEVTQTREQKSSVAVVLNVLMVHGHPALHIWVIFQVEPFASLSEAVQKSVPRLLINRDLVGPFALSPRSKDVAQLGDVVHGVERLVDLLGWTQELRDLIQQETGKVQILSSRAQSNSVQPFLVTDLNALLASRMVLLQPVAFGFLSCNSLLGHGFVTQGRGRLRRHSFILYGTGLSRMVC